MNIPDTNPIAAQLEQAAAALDWSIHRDDWWGPARNAFDSELQQLRDRARALAVEARAMS
jgi:hypothetical protein